MPIHAHFGGFWGTFLPNDVTHRPNPKRDRPWAELRHLSQKTRKSFTRFELGVGTRKKGQEKITKGLYFTYLGRSPHWSDVHENLFSRWCSRHNHVYQVWKWNFKGLQFYRGSNFPFPIDFWMGLTTVQRYCAACDGLFLEWGRFWGFRIARVTRCTNAGEIDVEEWTKSRLLHAKFHPIGPRVWV